MESVMIRMIADNILSPAGLDTIANYNYVLSLGSQVRVHDNAFDLPEPFCGSLFLRDKILARAKECIPNSEDYTFFESLCILSACNAIAHAQMNAATANRIEAASDDVIFILSTTKGNVDSLENDLDDPRAYLATSARKIAGHFGNSNEPIVVSNACISGVCAQIAAVRALLGGKYRYAIVIGCDVLSKFIISGFQSFKALSPECCRPYDKNRMGLNLGEAAGTMILESCEADECSNSDWVYVASSIHNDANHISGPSRTGEGSYRVLKDLLQIVDHDEIRFVNAHGTATPYNDEMESIAIHRAALDNVPVNGLKGFYGHTLGAAGIIETILSMKALENGIVLPTIGFESTGTSYPLNIANQIGQCIQYGVFIKLLSGFGGSNAGIAWRREPNRKEGGGL